MNVKGEKLKEWRQLLERVKKEFDKLFDPAKQKKNIIEMLAKKYNLSIQTAKRACEPIRFGLRDGKAKNADQHREIMKKLNRKRLKKIRLSKNKSSNVN